MACAATISGRVPSPATTAAPKEKLTGPTPYSLVKPAPHATANPGRVIGLFTMAGSVSPSPSIITKAQPSMLPRTGSPGKISARIGPVRPGAWKVPRWTNHPAGSFGGNGKWAPKGTVTSSSTGTL